MTQEKSSPVGQREASCGEQIVSTVSSNSAGGVHTKPVKCADCKGGSYLRRKYKNSASKVYCTTCDGIGWHGINPRKACPDLPGSSLKLGFLAARYRTGVVFWNRHDRVK